MTGSPKRFLRRGLAVLAVLAAATLFFVWQQEGIMSETYTVRSEALPAAFDGLRIVQVSDLHGKEFGADSERLLKAVAKLEPDLIAVTGDLIDRAEQLEMVPALARGLAAIAPTYYVTGNHEWAVRRVGDLKELLRENGVRVLTNSFEVWERDGATLAVAGVDDPNGPADQKTGVELRGEIQADYVLLLAHRDSVETYGSWGYDLVLCGHGHGGIVRIPVLDRGLLATDRTLFPRFDGGMYGLDNGGYCVVSRGLGSNTTPFRAFRLFNRPELVEIVLKSSGEEAAP